MSNEATLRHLKSTLWPEAHRTQDVDLADELLHDVVEMIDDVGDRSTKKDELDYVREHAWDPGEFISTIGRLSICSNGTAFVDVTGDAHTYTSGNVLIKQDGRWQAIGSHVSGYAEKGAGDESGD